MNFYLENLNGPWPSTVWQFIVPAARLSTAWITLMDRGNPDRAFRCEGSSLRPITLSQPGPNELLQRVIVGSPFQSRTRIYFGPWQGQHPLVQFSWTDGTQLADSSTAQLRRLQVRHAASRHNALNRWEARLGCSIPDDIWHLTWLSFRSATENTFFVADSDHSKMEVSKELDNGSGNLVLRVLVGHRGKHLPLHLGLPHLTTLLDLGVSSAPTCLSLPSVAPQPQAGTHPHCGGPPSGLGCSFPPLALNSCHPVLA